tara:strand:+ start:6195 stop:7628 length:1434 start_codon:yes stop_codon:yes gene_type:complete
MAVFYNKERAKYGHLTGQVIAWPVPYEGTPDQASNEAALPAGYLKCDGSKYFASDYPRLAAILGTGTNTAFMKKNLDGTDFETINDNQFMVPDLGSKYPEPTSGANAGVYNNVRKIDETTGTEKSRSGVGIDAEAAIGDTNVTVTYTGSINVPSQEIEIKGKPSWTYAGTTHYTEIESVEENQIHPHMHFSSSSRSRLRAQPDLLEVDNDTPKPAGQTGLKNASTIPIQSWLDSTRAQQQSTNPPGSGQEPCKLLDAWNPNGGTNDSGSPLYSSGLGSQTIYYGGCIAEDATGPYRIGSGSGFEYGCLNNSSYTVDRRTLAGSPDEQNTIKYRTRRWFPLLPCTNQSGDAGFDAILTVPVTYTAGAVGMPTDFNNSALDDVVPLQSNESAVSSTCIPDVENEATDTADIPIAAGTLPTAHNHRVRLEKGDHTYKVKTDAISIDPENLLTTFDIGVDDSISIDSATQPFIVMEYLIKI